MGAVVLAIANGSRVIKFFGKMLVQSELGVEPRGHTFDKLAKASWEMGNMAFENSFKFDQGFVIKSDGFYFGEVNICINLFEKSHLC